MISAERNRVVQVSLLYTDYISFGYIYVEIAWSEVVPFFSFFWVTPILGPWLAVLIYVPTTYHSSPFHRLANKLLSFH